jgi:hypothetical protein
MMAHPEEYVFSNYPFNSSKWPGWTSIQQADMQSLLLGNVSLDTVLAKWNNYWK